MTADMPVAISSRPFRTSAPKSGCRSRVHGVIRAGITPLNASADILASVLEIATRPVGAMGVLIATAEQSKSPVFIAGDQPVTEDQVRQKLQSEGYSNVQIVRQGQYFEAMGSKDGQTGKVTVDSQTGRLRDDDDDD
jgi:hypothetical protein